MKYSFETWKSDFLASVVVFLVALPLCMGIAIASGLPPAAGLITGMVGGLLVSLLSGCCLQVSGPAAGLAVIVWQLVDKYKDEPGVLGIIILLAGLIQLIAGFAKLGQWFRAVSPAVIHGMLAGIGVLIFASQFHVMVDDAPKGSGLINLVSIPGAIWKGLVPNNGFSIHNQAAVIGILTIIIIIAWIPLAPKKIKFIPAPLLAVVFGTLAAYLLGFASAGSDAGIRCVKVPHNLLEAVTIPTAEVWQNVWLKDLAWPIILAALSMALVASAETLLSATAVDKMHRGPRTRYDRELVAQGTGNMICGFLGALPMTGVIVRSGANVQAGAKTRYSSFMHGIWLLLFVTILPFVLELVPTASLAAILVYTGYKLVNPQAIRNLYHYGKAEVFIYAATVTGIVAIDLLTGVLIGIGLAFVKLLYTFSHLSIEMELDEDGKCCVLHMKGAATFIGLPKLATSLEKVPPDAELHVQFQDLSYIDHACLDLLINWEKQHESTGGSLRIDWESLTARFHQYGANPNNGVAQAGPAESTDPEQLVHQHEHSHHETPKAHSIERMRHSPG